MKVIWIAGISDCEFELTAAVARNPDIQLVYYCVLDPKDKNNNFHCSQLTKAKNIEIIDFTLTNKIGMMEQAVAQHTDLVILRHPVWIASEKEGIELSDIFRHSPVVVWTWEWVPNYAMSQMPPLQGWKRIAVTNSQDFKRCCHSYPDAQALTLPFGVVDRNLKECEFTSKYAANLICDAQPHYDCLEYNSIKKRSVDTMVTPVLDLQPALWGNRYGEVTKCDWLYNSKFSSLVRGTYPTMDYPRIYGSSSIYLGVSWNALTGGYSIRLARALSCGIPTIWEDTIGREKDFKEQNIVLWSADSTTTRKYVEFLMSHDRERIELGERGFNYAKENWEWGKQLRKLVKEIQ